MKTVLRKVSILFKFTDGVLTTLDFLGLFFVILLSVGALFYILIKAIF
jgi:hypothetical protein